MLVDIAASVIRPARRGAATWLRREDVSSRVWPDERDRGSCIGLRVPEEQLSGIRESPGPLSAEIKPKRDFLPIGKGDDSVTITVTRLDRGHYKLASTRRGVGEPTKLTIYGSLFTSH